MIQSQKFWDKVAKKYATQPVADEATYQKKLEITRNHFRPDMKLLEIGCGTGSTAIIHAPHVGHIRAVDFSDKMLAVGRERAEAAGIDNIVFECSDTDDMAMEPEAYDMVLALNVLHLLPNYQNTIKQVYQTLKPGGFLITSTVCLKDGFGLMGYLIPVMQFLGRAPYVAYFSAQELEAEYLAAGFDIESNWQPGPKKGVFTVLKKPG